MYEHHRPKHSAEVQKRLSVEWLDQSLSHELSPRKGNCYNQNSFAMEPKYDNLSGDY